MNGRTHTLLAIAMSTALVAPMAFAQKAKTEVKATTEVSSQAAAPKPTQATQRAAEKTTEVARQKMAEQNTTSTPRPADAVDARVVPTHKIPVQTGKATEDPTTDDPTTAAKDMPPTSQGADHAAAHSSVVQRDVWSRLDADGDGQISAT